jgi:hypothetical protein
LSWKVVLLSLALSTLGPSAYAASAVAFDGKKLKYGFAYNLPSESEAVDRALKGCFKRGGRDCRIVVSCGESGFGAIYTGRFRGHPVTVIGASCGAASADEAHRAAALSCNAQLRSNQCAASTVGWHDTLE